MERKKLIYCGFVNKHENGRFAATAQALGNWDTDDNLIIFTNSYSAKQTVCDVCKPIPTVLLGFKQHHFCVQLEPLFQQIGARTVRSDVI
jgi:hypothetical protein